MDDINVIYGVKPTVPVFNGTAGEQIYEALLKYQDLPEAMICAETHRIISYKEILEESCQLAQALLLNGYSQNTTIGLYCENCLEYLYPVMAAWYLGMIIAPLNFEYIKKELHHAINLSKPEIMFCSMKTLANVQELSKEQKYFKKIIVIDLDVKIEGVESLKSFVGCNSNKYLDVYHFKPTKFNCAQQDAAILCSSGTTGLPKGVVMTHKNLVHRFAHTKEPEFMFVENPKTTMLSFAPRFHIIGLFSSIEGLLLGYRAIVMKKFEPNLFLRCIQNYKIRFLRLPPPIMVFLAKSPLCNNYDLSSLEDLLCGAAPLSKDIEALVQKRLGKHVLIRQGYGLTEATMGVTYNPKSCSKLGAVGRIVPQMAVKIVDIESGKSLEANKPGEIWVKGPLVTRGYISNQASTAITFLPNGWLRTGDIGYYDKEEYLYIIDRLKELIKYNGFQVAPAELEALLLEHPQISDVGVIGIPDETAGQLPTAFVCLKPGAQLTENEVMQYISSQVSPQKRLRGGVYFVSEIPKTASGKILRRKLHQLYKFKSSKL